MVARGETIVLTSTFRSWEDGPLVAVTDVQVQIMLGSTVIAGPFTDVTMLGTGLAEYQWTVPANAVPGVYYARWSAVYPGASQPSVGIEAFTVETFAGVYAGCPWPRSWTPPSTALPKPRRPTASSCSRAAPSGCVSWASSP